MHCCDMPREELILIKGVPSKAVNRMLRIIAETSNVTSARSLTNNPTTLIARYTCGRDALLALGSLTVWVDDKWNVAAFGRRPTVMTNHGRVAKPPFPIQNTIHILTRPSTQVDWSWGAAASWREHDVELAVTVA